MTCTCRQLLTLAETVFLTSSSYHVRKKNQYFFEISLIIFRRLSI